MSNERTIEYKNKKKKKYDIKIYFDKRKVNIKISFHYEWKHKTIRHSQVQFSKLPSHCARNSQET